MTSYFHDVLGTLDKTKQLIFNEDSKIEDVLNSMKPVLSNISSINVAEEYLDGCARTLRPELLGLYE